MPDSASGMGQFWLYVQTGGQEAGEQPRRKQHVVLVDGRVECESAVCPVSPKSQPYPGKGQGSDQVVRSMLSPLQELMSLCIR